jgi:hypothetical protein
LAGILAEGDKRWHADFSADGIAQCVFQRFAEQLVGDSAKKRVSIPAAGRFFLISPPRLRDGYDESFSSAG